MCSSKLLDAVAQGRCTPRARQRPRACTLGMRLRAALRWRAARAWISTPGWLSLYVLNTCSFLVGMVVLRVISVVCARARPVGAHACAALPSCGAMGARQLGQAKAPHRRCTVSADPRSFAASWREAHIL